MVTLMVNGERHELEVDPEMPLAWVLRDKLGLTGTHVSCALGVCGACTVHVDGQAMRSCVLPASSLEGRSITTIEGLSSDGSHPVQQAWIAEDVVQCGYCQSGFIMAAAALLANTPNPTDRQINESLSNICRCGTYVRVRKAIHRAARLSRERK
ncbi:(2Fe-2S)-binding protein [Arenimonas sp.]|uniref:(2Fe-2S)-binding protein n=1 Tax=Arenimonas sp. TaxID=1872635 RepID=UPI0039E3F9F6